ncbi:MAG: PQQ-dependent sugar dehydrogenase [Haloferula sp.]
MTQARVLLPCLSLFAPLASQAAELPNVTYQEFASGLISPIGMISYLDGDEAFLVSDQSGVVFFLGAEGGKPTGTFLDLRGRMAKLRDGFDERGLLGIALHPEFPKTRKVYVHYSAPLQKGGTKGFDHTAHISEFTIPEGERAANPSSERVILAIDTPQWNHNGGNPVFGPDGYLYVGIGDGGGGSDLGDGHVKGGNGQHLDTLLGKILRIDINGKEPYEIPADNPLVGKAGQDEIFAWGIRNPWGLSFDDGRLIVADVGQHRFEEINLIENGGNYGWPRAEGFAAFDQENPTEPAKLEESTASDEFMAPVLAYPQNDTLGKSNAYGISVTGGHVYRGSALPSLKGNYIFADWGTSWATSKQGIFVGIPDPSGKWSLEVLDGKRPTGNKEAMVTGMARDKDGEVYILTNGSREPRKPDGFIWKIVPAK